MWIEFDDRLINLNNVTDIFPPRLIDKNKWIIILSTNQVIKTFNALDKPDIFKGRHKSYREMDETYDTKQQAQARYEEIKKMLVNNQNLIIEKLDEIIEDLNYWGKEIEGTRR